MIHRPDLLDRLEQLGGAEWSGQVFRHMFARLPPQRENVEGARWNPKGLAAIYASLEPDTALAEAEYRISLEPLRPSKGRTLYQLQVKVASVVDLRGPGLLDELGISAEQLLDPLAIRRCQEIGAAAAFLDYKGLLVPSVRRREGSNLVIFSSAAFEIVKQQDL